MRTRTACACVARTRMFWLSIKPRCLKCILSCHSRGLVFGGTQITTSSTRVGDSWLGFVGFGIPWIVQNDARFRTYLSCDVVLRSLTAVRHVYCGHGRLVKRASFARMKLQEIAYKEINQNISRAIASTTGDGLRCHVLRSPTRSCHEVALCSNVLYAAQKLGARRLVQHGHLVRQRPKCGNFSGQAAI